PGILETFDVSLFAGSHFKIEIGGTTPGGYDQLQVHGGVSLADAMLDASFVNGFTPTVGQSFTIIDNDGSDAIGGTFANLAEGAFVNINGTALSISYHGGDGNDVTLTALSNDAPANIVPGTQSVTENTSLSLSGLLISDRDVGFGRMTTTLSVAHGTLTVN